MRYATVQHSAEASVCATRIESVSVTASKPGLKRHFASWIGKYDVAHRVVVEKSWLSLDALTGVRVASHKLWLSDRPWAVIEI
jgi:hypothetical protein